MFQQARRSYDATPRHFISDQGSQFTSDEFKALLRTLGIRPRLGALYKHGSIALLDPDTPLIGVATASHVYEKIVSNIQEVRARDAHIIVVATEGDEAIKQHADDVLYVPATLEVFSPLLASIPLQLFAYHAAVARGCNVDQPRNLAKSVTVE